MDPYRHIADNAVAVYIDTVKNRYRDDKKKTKTVFAQSAEMIDKLADRLGSGDSNEYKSKKVSEFYKKYKTKLAPNIVELMVVIQYLLVCDNFLNAMYTASSTLDKAEERI